MAHIPGVFHIKHINSEKNIYLCTLFDSLFLKLIIDPHTFFCQIRLSIIGRGKFYFYSYSKLNTSV